jgi:flagellar biosynthetic protein FliS
MSNPPELSYQRIAVQGASPIGEIIALYDTILRDFGRALAAQAAGRIEERVKQFNHALEVIGYLESVLDHERGVEAAKSFASFYRVTRELIVRVNFTPTPENIQNLINLYGQVRNAWYQLEQRSKVNQPTAADEQTVRPAFDLVEVSQSHWSV